MGSGGGGLRRRRRTLWSGVVAAIGDSRVEETSNQLLRSTREISNQMQNQELEELEKKKNLGVKGRTEGNRAEGKVSLALRS
ncbi:hypothetical protein ABZP36_020226 [Zizania latifolia]